MAVNINVVVLTGNLTKDPELRSLPSGTAVCSLRVASNTSRKDSSTGEWKDKPNFFDVTVWGGQGESTARYLRKGSKVAISGRLDWREWEVEGGGKRQAVQIVAEQVQFLDPAGNDDARADTAVAAAQEVANDDDNIPFLWDGCPSYEDRRSHVSRW